MLECECNPSIIDYLDVHFDLKEGAYKPFKKKNATTMHVKSGSMTQERFQAINI